MCACVWECCLCVDTIVKIILITNTSEVTYEDIKTSHHEKVLAIVMILWYVCVFPSSPFQYRPPRPNSTLYTYEPPYQYAQDATLPIVAAKAAPRTPAVILYRPPVANPAKAGVMAGIPVMSSNRS